MKKIGLFILFIIAVSLLSACSGNQREIKTNSHPEDGSEVEEEIIADEKKESDEITNEIIEVNIDEGGEKEYIYSNQEVGITVFENNNWFKDKEFLLETLNVTFRSDDTRAILSVFDIQKNKNDIFKEIKVGAGEVTLLDESESFLSFKTDRTESIRTNIYIKSDENYHYAITFMTLEDDYESNKGKIVTFMDNFKIKERE